MDLFNALQLTKEEVVKDLYVLRSFALGVSEHLLLADLQAVILQVPLRNMMTKMGFKMSAAMTNCGDLGWTSDRKGYRYTAHDPLTNQAWPSMPASFLQLASSAATVCGFENFVPDACLINQYKVGSSMGLHQDKDELDFTQPIVSVSLGIPAVFAFGGSQRTDKTIKIPLQHGDVVVWGNSARQHHHAILSLKNNAHATLGAYRYNLTFRKAG